ncbi:MAG: hypothetical protein JW908_00715 [Anaerolineales bacterium]|nr:hypothetical protein [Anaerolineales bacterium]
MDVVHMIADIVWQVAVVEKDTRVYVRKPWLFEEEQFVRSKIGKMTDEEIGLALGRTEAAIKIRRIRKGMPAHSRRPGWLTGHQAAKTLGVDIHCIMKLSRMGILPMEIIPGVKGILNIRKAKLYQWAVNPERWIYFKVENVRDKKLKRLLALEAARWNDEWWTPGQAAAWHGVDQRDINRYIHMGKIQGKKWGNWRLKKSEVLKPGLYFPKGRGAGFSINWSDDADAFLIQAKAKGLSWVAIGKMMKKDDMTVAAHYRAIQRVGMINDLAEKYGIEI